MNYQRNSPEAFSINDISYEAHALQPHVGGF